MKHARKCVEILRELFTHIWAKLIAGRAKTLGKYTAVILETCFDEYIRYMKYMTNNRLLRKNKINCLLKSIFCCCFVTYSARDHFVYLFIFSFLLSLSLSSFLAKSLHINYLQMRRHRRKQMKSKHDK